MKYDYYRHRKMGFVNDYFGYIGDPVKIGMPFYWVLKIGGWRVTKVPRGSGPHRVAGQAIENAGHKRDTDFAKDTAKRFVKIFKEGKQYREVVQQ